jgi:hypothetical protein
MAPTVLLQESIVALKVRPCELKAANAYIAEHHRHHKPVVGHRFSLSVWDGDRLCGVAIVGRPVARLTDFTKVLEVTRLCTDGTKNACSILYAAAARVGKEMGYVKIQTFVLDTEPAVTLRAAGWTLEGVSAGGQWVHTAGPRRTDQPTNPKQRWAKILNEDAEKAA